MKLHGARTRALTISLAIPLFLFVGARLLIATAHAVPDDEFDYICAADGVGSVGTLALFIGGTNANPGLDEIIVRPAASSTADTCTFTAVTAEDDYGNGGVGLPLITDTLLIRGEGIAVVFERDPAATEDFRLLEATADLTLENVIVRAGRAAAPHHGGGILAHRSLTLTDAVLSDNVGDGGGGAYVAGSLTMHRTTLAANEPLSGSGGGAWIGDGLTATTITITGNTGGDATGAGLFVGGDAEITGASFADNGALQGGGLYIAGNLTLADSVFVSNTAGDDGGGLYAAGQAEITGAEFTENEAVQGGALYAAGDLTLADSAFYSNTAGTNGGGLLAAGALSISGVTFASNEAASGGGLYLETEGTDVQVTGALFEENVASTSGGGLYVLRHVAIEGSRFTGNAASEGGGGAFIATGTISDTLFMENTAAGLGVDYAGGGLLVLNDATVNGSRFLGNTGPEGAGAFLAHMPPASLSLVVNNLWVDNDDNAIFAGFTADSDDGGAHAELRHNTIVRDEQSGGSAIHVIEGSASVYNNVITGHSVGVGAGPEGDVTSNYNLFFDNVVHHAGVPSGSNNLDGNPRFVNAAAGNYHLRPESPAVDSGSAQWGAGADLDGVTRPQRGSFDRGAYEYVNVPPTAAADTYTTTAAAPLAVPARGVLGNDDDVEEDQLTALLVAGPDTGDLILNSDGSFTYTPAAGFTGTETFTYRADDGYDRSSPATVTLVVQPVRLYLPAALRMSFRAHPAREEGEKRLLRAILPRLVRRNDQGAVHF